MTVAKLTETTRRPFATDCFIDVNTRHLVQRIGDELKHRRPGVDLVVEGLLLELLGTLIRQRAIVEPRAWLRQAMDYLEVNFRQHFTVIDVATAAGINPSHLAEVFRRRYAMSVGEWVRLRRAEFAREALLDRTKPISGIAFDAGFADQSHLTRTFRARFGMTPAVYRRTMS